MGVCYYLVCKQCRKYIDLHKSKYFTHVFYLGSPPITSVDIEYNGYWDMRGFWFMCFHKEHKGIELRSDHDDTWFDDEPYLVESYPYRDDEKMRKAQD